MTPPRGRVPKALGEASSCLCASPKEDFRSADHPHPVLHSEINLVISGGRCGPWWPRPQLGNRGPEPAGWGDPGTPTPGTCPASRQPPRSCTEEGTLVTAALGQSTGSGGHAVSSRLGRPHPEGVPASSCDPWPRPTALWALPAHLSRLVGGPVRALGRTCPAAAMGTPGEPASPQEPSPTPYVHGHNHPSSKSGWVPVSPTGFCFRDAKP